MANDDASLLGAPALRFIGDALHVAWDVARVPPGCGVQVDVLDAAGAPLDPPPGVLPGDDGGVVVAGPAIVAGATIQVVLRVVSPPEICGPLALVVLTAPDALTTDWTTGGVAVRWRPVTGATGYRVVVADEGGVPLAPQPELRGDGPTAVTIDAATLADRTRYQVAVQAEAGPLRGPAAIATLDVDRSQPTSPALQALLRRLTDAMPDLALAPATIAAPDITGLLGRLLAVADDRLPLVGAALAHSPDTVTATGTATIFGRSAGVTAVFTAERGRLRLALRCALADVSIAELKQWGLAPPDLFGAAWVADLAAFPALELVVDSADRSAHVTGPANTTPWSVLGIPGVRLDPVTPDLRVYAGRPVDYPRHVPRLRTTLYVGERPVPMYLQLPSGLSPWQAGLDVGDDGYACGNLTDLAGLFGGAAPDLPAGLVALGAVTLRTLAVRFDPTRPAAWTWDLAFSLGTGALWPVVPGVLELSGLAAALRVRVAADGADSWTAATFGDITGHFALAGAPMSLRIAVPADADEWVLRGGLDDAERPIKLADMAPLLGGDTTALTAALAPLGAVDGFALRHLLLAFRPAPDPEIRKLRLAVSVGRWTAPDLPWLRLDGLALALDVDRPLVAADRRVRGELRGQLTLGGDDGVQLAVVTEFASDSARWSLRLVGRPAALAGLDQLSAVVAPQDLAAAAPPGLPLTGPAELVGLGFVRDTAGAAYFPQIDVALRSGLHWTIVPDLLVLDSVDVALRVTRDAADAPSVVTGRVTGRIVVAGASLELGARKPTGADPWTFTGQLLRAHTIDFQAALRQLVAADLALPAGHGLPTALTLVTAEATLVPATGALDLLGFAYTDWSLEFAGTTFAVSALGGQLHRAGADGEPSWGRIVGWFTWQSLAARASLQVGGPGVDTVLEVAATTTTLAADITADALVGTAGAAWASLPLPPRLAPISVTGVALVANLTRGALLLHGAAAGLGRAGLLVQRLQGDTWGFFAAASLADEFRFADITPGLGVLDGALRLTAAGFGVSSLSAAALADLGAAMPGLADLVNRGAVPLEPGAELWGTLVFDGPLFANLADLLGGSPAIALHARIAPRPADSVFRAALADLVLLQAVTFESLALEVRPGDPDVPGSQLRLALVGDLAVSVGETTLTFHDELRITAAEARFTLATTQELVAPLGMRGVILRGLELDLRRTFTDPPTTTLALAGRAKFGPVELTGAVLFVDGAPQIVELALSAPLPVDDLLTAVLPDNLWPTGWLDITFATGRMYYAAAAGVVLGATYRQGFCVESTIDVFGVRFLVDAQVLADGLTVTGKADRSIDLVVARLTAPSFTPASSPALVITTVGDDKRLGLELGLVLFDTNVGAASLDYSIPRREFTGSVGLTILGGDTRMTFAWSRERGLRILAWPIAFLSTAFDYASRLTDLSAALSSGSGCAALVKLAFQQTITTAYSVDIASGDTTPAPPGGYVIPLAITCTARAAGQDILSASIVVPLVLTTPGELTFAAFATALEQSIVASAEAIVRDLLTDPAKFAAFIAVAGIETLGAATIASLLCRQVQSAAVEAQSIAEVEAGVATAESAASAAEAAAGTAMAAGDAAAAAAAAEGTFVAVGVIAGALALFAGIVAGIRALFGIDKSPEEQRADAARDRAATARDRAIAEVERRLAVADLALAHTAETTLRATWARVDGDGVRYTATLLRGDDRLFDGDVDRPALDVTDPRIVPGATYTLRVSAWLAGESRTFRGAADQTTLTINTLPAPTRPTLLQIEASLVLTWQAPAAARVEVRLLDAAGAR